MPKSVSLDLSITSLSIIASSWFKSSILSNKTIGLSRHNATDHHEAAAVLHLRCRFQDTQIRKSQRLGDRCKVASTEKPHVFDFFRSFDFEFQTDPSMELRDLHDLACARESKTCRECFCSLLALISFTWEIERKNHKDLEDASLWPHLWFSHHQPCTMHWQFVQKSRIPNSIFVFCFCILSPGNSCGRQFLVCNLASIPRI